MSLSLISRNTSKYSSFPARFGLQPHGVIKALHFCAWTRRDSDGEFGFDWFVLNLESGEISLALSRMPPAARRGSTAVAWLNHILALGGACCRDPTCPDGKIHEIHLHDCVFYIDIEHPENGWTRASPMLLQRDSPAAVAIQGKVYVFGGSALDPFAEVFDLSQNSWALLPAPSASDMDPVSVSYPVLLDSSRSQILVHFTCNNSLYAYHVDDKSWECLKANFGEWSRESVIVDGVLYCLFNTRDNLYYFSAVECSLKAYDLVQNKWLPTKWISEFEVWISNLSDLFHLGNGKLCLALYSPLEMLFNYIKFSVCKNSEEIYATGESESVTCVPFQTSYCQISLL